jgi:DNA polymerase I
LPLAQLLQSIDQELGDPSRIQSLLFGVVVIAASGHNSFSLAAMSTGGGGGGGSAGGMVTASLTSGPTVAHRKRLLQLVEGFLVMWRDDLMLLSPTDGLDLLVALDRNGPRGSADIDLVVWDAPSVLLPLFAHQFATAGQRCLASPPHPLDVRIMGWMLDPSDACADFDALHLRHMPGARLSSFPMTTFEGACDRAVQMISLYRRLYAAIGSKGLLQSLLKQERPTTFVCALMKYDGFSVDVSQLEALKQCARDAAATLKAEALSLLRPHIVEINLQSPDDCREALYGVLNLGRFLSSQSADSLDTAAVTKGGKLSTAEEVLRKLSPHHRLPQILLEHRKINKILQTYIEGILEGNAVAIDDDDRFCAEIGYTPYERESIDEFLISSGDAPEIHRMSTTLARKEKLRRVHASFLQYGTDTGRLSCIEPNLQNLPRTGDDVAAAVATSSSLVETASRDDGGIRAAPTTVEVASLLTSSVRNAFVPLPGCDLVAFDYEQIELRVLAHLSNDAHLVDALGGNSGAGLVVQQRGGGNEDVDIHRSIAAVIFRKSNPSLVTKEERSQAKRVVFGVLYGMGPRALAAQLNESLDRAVYIQNAFKQGFPHLDRYHARVVAQCRQDNGVVRTLCGRIRTLSDINDSNQTKRSLAERQAFNTVIQGSAADVVKRAMSAVYEHVLQDAEFRGRIRLHCQVHDELVFSIPREFLQRAVGRIRECMTSCMLLSVPLRVAVQVGPSYGSLVAFKDVV